MKNQQKLKQSSRVRRRARVRARVSGTKERPRFSVYKSLKHIYAQVIDDTIGKTLVSASDLKLGKKKLTKQELSGKLAVAYEVGKLAASKAKDLGINEVIFDRGGRKFHGRIKAAAEGARSAGLKF